MADDVGSPLRRSECNLTWQQLPDKFGWVRKLYPQLQVQRRAGLAAPRWGLPPHPSFSQASPASMRSRLRGLNQQKTI